MKQEEVTFLIEKFKPSIGYTLMKDVLSNYLEAERILTQKENQRKISCKCEIPELKDNTERLFNNWYKTYKE